MSLYMYIKPRPKYLFHVGNRLIDPSIIIPLQNDISCKTRKIWALSQCYYAIRKKSTWTTRVFACTCTCLPYVELEDGDADAVGRPGAGQTDEVATADVTGEQWRPHLHGKQENSGYRTRTVKQWLSHTDSETVVTAHGQWNSGYRSRTVKSYRTRTVSQIYKRNM